MICLGQNPHFLHPQWIGNTLMAQLAITAFDPVHHRATLRTRRYVRNLLVIDGEALVMIPT